MPPVVDEDIDRFERLDVVPPQRGNEQGVSRPEFGALRCSQGGAEPGKALEVRGIEFNQAEGRACWRKIERPNIEIADLFRRKERKAASAADDAADIAPLIQVYPRNHRIAQPD